MHFWWLNYDWIHFIKLEQSVSHWATVSIQPIHNRSSEVSCDICNQEKAMKMKSGFRNTQWDPLLLIAQIIAVQSVLYVSLGLMMAILDVFVGANHTLDHLFQYHVRLCTHSTDFHAFITCSIWLFCIFICRKFMSPILVDGRSSYLSYWMLLLVL